MSLTKSEQVEQNKTLIQTLKRKRSLIAILKNEDAKTLDTIQTNLLEAVEEIITVREQEEAKEAEQKALVQQMKNQLIEQGIPEHKIVELLAQK